MEQVGWHRTLDLSDSQKQAEVDAVLGSATFARSEQLRSFLRYVCQMEMVGRAEELNEYSIGIEALGRPSDYSPIDDSSVRSRAWELRQKLLKLYSSERNYSELRIDIPKGGYVPHYFVRDSPLEQQAAESQPSSQATLPAVNAGTERHNIRNYVVVAVLSALLGALSIFGVSTLWKESPTSTIDPVLREAWGPLLQPGSPDRIVMANAFYFLIRPEFGVGGPGAAQYPVPEQVYDQYREKRPLSAGGRLTMITSDNAIQMGYVSGLVGITGLLQQAKAPFELLPERVVATGELRERNVILFGAPQDSITITDLLGDGQFHFRYSATHDIVLQRRNEAVDNAQFYFSGNRDPDRHETYTTYGLLTVVPSLGSEVQGPKTVIFSGITSVGAQGAAEFFSSVAHMRQLKDLFQKAGFPGFPPAYQVVVRCKGKDTLLLSFEYADSAIISEK